MEHITPLFSIIIPTYRRNHQLCDCLDLLSSYFDPNLASAFRCELELIICDDAHDPELKELLSRHYPWCRYTDGPACGPAANRNRGAHQATGVWLLFIDDDCLPQPGWLEAFAQHAHHCVVMEGKTSAVGSRTRLDQECPINETGGYLWSCNFAIRRDAFFRIGGFNELFPVAAMEDVEIQHRIIKAGYMPMFVPNAEVKHPWRHRQSFNFVRAKAKSVATYVWLHPEKIPSFSLVSQIANLFRMFRATIAASLSIGTIQGFSNQIVLDTYYVFTTWQAVKRVRQSRLPPAAIIQTQKL